MPWCPNCKTEYENHVDTCADCGVALVEEAEYEKVINYTALVHVPESEINDIVDYLKYSNITDIKTGHSEKGLAIFVEESQHAEAVRFLKVYMQDRVDEDEEDYYFSEYETVDVDTNLKEKDLRSSGFSFSVIGSLLLIFGVLNIFGFMDTLKPGIYLYVLTALGIVFIGIGIQSYLSVAGVIANDESTKNKIDNYMSWFDATYTKESYLKAKDLKLEDYDEGSLYFVIIDGLKAELVAMHPDEDEVMINSTCESIFVKYFS